MSQDDLEELWHDFISRKWPVGAIDEDDALKALTGTKVNYQKHKAKVLGGTYLNSIGAETDLLSEGQS